MALPYESGFLGSLIWVTDTDPNNPRNAPEWNVNITYWRLRYSRKMLGTTVIGQSYPFTPGHQAMIAGVSSWSAKVEFLMPATWDVGVQGFPSYNLQEVEVVLLQSSGNGYEGSALLGDMEIDNPLDGPMKGRATLFGNRPDIGLTILGDTVFPEAV